MQGICTGWLIHILDAGWDGVEILGMLWDKEYFLSYTYKNQVYEMIPKKDLWCSPSYCVYILCVFVLINVTYRQKNVFFLKKRSVVSIIPGLGLLLMICNWTSSQMDHRKYTRRGRIIFLHVNRTLTLKLVSCPTEYSSSVYNTVSICSHHCYLLLLYHFT